MGSIKGNRPCYQLCSKLKVKQAIAEDVKQTKVLAYITSLKKLCNYPKGCHLGKQSFDEAIVDLDSLSEESY
ncbi:hypothetical protein L1987_42545 [Smallanthus sonchifolius]|uniref:Uncharacterized protein n=1 Tax=Smallanthus sonchifolius TaxID=185202 RepID=A0ACB9GL40_9ASTR|nr:hypothetical protein L1987_42545 [Smallanthus sonchifolius]